MSAHLIILVSTIGALAAAVTALVHDRNALVWFVLGAFLPGVSLLVMRIERSDAALIAVSVALAAVVAVETAALVLAHRELRSVQPAHARHVEFCDAYKREVHAASVSIEGTSSFWLDENARRLLDLQTMELCGLQSHVHRRAVLRALTCWAETRDAGCYEGVFAALDKEIR